MLSFMEIKMTSWMFLMVFYFLLFIFTSSCSITVTFGFNSLCIHPRGKKPRPGWFLKHSLCWDVSMAIWQCRLVLSFLVAPQWGWCVIKGLVMAPSLTVHSSVPCWWTKTQTPASPSAYYLIWSGPLSVRQPQQHNNLNCDLVIWSAVSHLSWQLQNILFALSCWIGLHNTPFLHMFLKKLIECTWLSFRSCLTVLQ